MNYTTQEDAIRLYQQKVESGLMKEDTFMVEQGAMHKDGTIICEYPKLVYYIKGEEKTWDEKGSLIGLNAKKEVLEREQTPSHIEYFPRFYSFILEYKILKAKKERDSYGRDIS